MIELTKQKFDKADQRHEEIINNIKSRAKNETAKVNETQFINMLEMQNKKFEMDEKLKEVREKKI